MAIISMPVTIREVTAQIIAVDDEDKSLFEGYLYTDTHHTLGVSISGLSAYYQSYDVYK